ncbi:MAG: hypothetical protein HY461_01625 [Parcubacteria group bacterium]|nr:hypothetical protein [Parcubacteria group bacterium]
MIGFDDVTMEGEVKITPLPNSLAQGGLARVSGLPEVTSWWYWFYAERVVGKDILHSLVKSYGIIDGCLVVVLENSEIWLGRPTLLTSLANTSLLDADVIAGIDERLRDFRNLTRDARFQRLVRPARLRAVDILTRIGIGVVAEVQQKRDTF